MSNNQGKNISACDKPEKLFSEFVREMDEQSSNGIVKKLDPLKIEPMVDHFLEQCSSFEEKLELRENIQVLLSAKFNYALAEERLALSAELEKNIHNKIKDALKRHFENAAKYAGFILNWAILKPVKFVKTTVEPVIANTVLTYSIAVHPPYLASVEVMELHAMKLDKKSRVETVQTDNNSSELLKALKTVRKYSDEDFANLTQNVIKSNDAVNEKKIVAATKVKPSSAAMNTSISHDDKASQTVYVDLQRRIIQHTPAAVNSDQSRLSVSRYGGELRPIGDVQRIIAQNDHRIYNCFNVYKKNSQKKNGRISMKFQISSKGMVKDVKITYNSFNEALAERVMLQIKTVRFGEIESRLGDQTVYHTFYF
ncbi:AgmX/PglI C-terminal domain-containing protein [bacterium]|nr:AgmX/PglI C-terminal domain-containing protein [bacterium]